MRETNSLLVTSQKTKVIEGAYNLCDGAGHEEGSDAKCRAAAAGSVSHLPEMPQLKEGFGTEKRESR